MSKSTKTKKNVQANEPSPPAGVVITAKKVNVGGDVVGNDKIEVGRQQDEPVGVPASETNEANLGSAWANGLFYVFVLVVVMGVIAWIGNWLEPLVLGIVVIAGLIAIPLIGALQLMMDKRISQKSFLALMRLVIRQLPLISGFTKKG